MLWTQSLQLGWPVLQSSTRKELVKLDSIEDENERRVRAAGVIQSNWRRWWGREQLRRRALTKEEMFKLKSSAATLMQAMFRGMRGKKGALF